MSDPLSQPIAPTVSGPETRVRALVEEVLAGTDLFIVEVAVRGQKGSRVVEVYLDSDDGPTVTALAKISRALGFLLDTEEVLAGKYTLNVSTPGADRPLRLPRQYRKHLGRKLRVRYLADGARQKADGTLDAVEDDAIVLGRPGHDALRLVFQDIEEAKVLLPW